jgi:hypothetical protein
MSWLRLIEESMKAKTPSAAAGGDEVSGEIMSNPGEPVPKADEPARKPSRGDRFRHLIGEMWPAYLIEIVVIILGISITLALEEWRDGAKEDRLRNIYRGNLLADIDTDLEGLQKTSGATTFLLARGEEILGAEKSFPAHTLSDSALISDLRTILGRPKFISQEATFQDLKSSGNLHLVKDIALKSLLFAYYNLVQRIEENQEAEQQATIILVGPYFLKRIPLDDIFKNSFHHEKTADLDDIVDENEFRNLMLLRITTRTDLLALYQSAESLALKIKGDLQQN